MCSLNLSTTISDDCLSSSEFPKLDSLLNLVLKATKSLNFCLDVSRMLEISSLKLISSPCWSLTYSYALWYQYEFSLLRSIRYPKLVRFLTKNQHIQRKLLYYVKLPFLISLFTKSMPNFCQPSIAPVHNNFLWVWPKILLILDTWHLSKKNKLILPDIKEKLEYETIFFA